MLLFHRFSAGAMLVSLLAAGFLFSNGHAEANLIINGDFESGNTGFSSDYTYLAPPGSENMIEAYYTICTDPRYVHSKWTSMGDHTTGTGMMLIANGAANSALAIWQQDVTLTAGVTYDFSAWATSVFSGAPANLIFEIGGISLGTLQLTKTVPDWQLFSAEFTAITSGPTQLAAIRDLVTYPVGNDFAIDDISLHVVPEPSFFVICTVLAGLGTAVSLCRRFW